MVTSRTVHTCDRVVSTIPIVTHNQKDLQMADRTKAAVSVEGGRGMDHCTCKEMVSYRKQKRQATDNYWQWGLCTVRFYMQCQCWNKHVGRVWLRAHQFRLQFRFRYFAIPQNQRLSRGSKLSSSVAGTSHTAHCRALAGDVTTVKPLTLCSLLHILCNMYELRVAREWWVLWQSQR